MFQFFNHQDPYLGPSRIKMLKSLKSEAPLSDRRADRLFQEALRLLIKAHDRISLEQAIDALKYVKIMMEYKDEIQNKAAVLAYDKTYILLCAAIKAHNIQDPYGHISEPKELHVQLLQDPSVAKNKAIRKEQESQDKDDKLNKTNQQTAMPLDKQKLVKLIDKMCAEHEKLFTLYMLDAERLEKHKKYHRQVKKVKSDIDNWNKNNPDDKIDYFYFPIPLHSDEILFFLYKLFTTYEELMLAPRKHKPEYVTEEIQKCFDSVKEHADGWVPWLRIIYQMIYRAVKVQRFEVAQVLLDMLDNNRDGKLVKLIISDSRMSQKDTTVVKLRLMAMRELIAELKTLCWLEETSVGPVPVPTRLAPKDDQESQELD